VTHDEQKRADDPAAMRAAAAEAVAASWDAEYRAGRYADEEPVAFVWDVLERSHARAGCPLRDVRWHGGYGERRR
jgi:hypothetical protein